MTSFTYRGLLIASLFWSLVAHGAQTEELPESPAQTVERFCKSYRGEKDFLPQMTQTLLKDEIRRAALIRTLQTGDRKNGCVRALSNHLDQWQKDTKITDSRGQQAYFMLAVVAKLDQAKKIIEAEIDRGQVSTWLDVLAENDAKTYLQALEKWVLKVGEGLRKVDNAELSKAANYGKISANNMDIKPPADLQLWSPLLLSRYLSEVEKQKKKLTQKEFAALDIIYAASTASYREVFADAIAKAIKLNDSEFILNFRQEPTWVQFRLVPLLGKAGSGSIKRELIWLSNYHQDFKMRAVALNALENLAKK